MRLLMFLAVNWMFFAPSWSSDRADARDQEVLKATLDLLLPKEEKPPIVILAEMTENLGRMPSMQVPDGSIRKSKPTQEETKSLIDILNLRNSVASTNTGRVSISLATLNLGPQVVISSEPEKTLKEYQEKHRFPTSWLQASLPGFSIDGRLAVVCLMKFPESKVEFIRVFFERNENGWKLLRTENFLSKP